MFTIVKVKSFVAVLGACVLAEAHSKSILECSFEIRTAAPKILALPFRLPVRIKTLVSVAICEGFVAVSVLEALFEASLVAVAINPLMDAVAIRFPIFPVTLIRVAFLSYPCPLSLLLASEPLPLVILAIGPDIFSLAFGTAINVKALKIVLRGEPFVSVSVLTIVVELPFVYMVIIK